MERIRLVLMIALSVGLVGGAAVLAVGSAPAQTRAEVEVRDLLRGLSDSDLDVRRESENKLRALDQKALPAIREACGSNDLDLARRARRLLDEMEGRTAVKREEPRAEAQPMDPVEAPRPPVEITLEVPRTSVQSGDAIRFYVRLRNNTAQALLVARHKMRFMPLYREFAKLEVLPVGGESFTIDTELWPRMGDDGAPQLDIIAVPAQSTIDLYAGVTEIASALHTRLMRTGAYQVRFVYDATGPYVEALNRQHAPGLALPMERIASNVVTINVQ